MTEIIVTKWFEEFLEDFTDILELAVENGMPVETYNGLWSMVVTKCKGTGVVATRGNTEVTINSLIEYAKQTLEKEGIVLDEERAKASTDGPKS